MLMISTPRRTAFAVLVLLVGVTAACASSATFAITGQGITLGEAKEVVEGGKEQPPRYHAKATVGKPFALTAQGIVLPRGGKAEPGEPETGTWSFDVKSFKKLAPEAPADKTKIGIRLEPTAPGTMRVRFEGKILGYERAFDVLIDVAGTK
jgi:hypothetical protein